MGVRRACMRESIRDAIASRILDGTYAPGTRLKELALAREFNVSQAPVREALRELAALHLVETEHYRGTRVRALDLSELAEAYELRFLIEQKAVERATPCRADDLQELDAETRAMTRLARQRDFDGYLDSAMRFHRRLVAMSGNRLFVRAWESMAWDIRVRVAVKSIGLIGLFHGQRRAIVRSLRAGNRRGATRALHEIATRLGQRLREIGERDAGAVRH